VANRYDYTPWGAYVFTLAGPATPSGNTLASLLLNAAPSFLPDVAGVAAQLVQNKKLTIPIERGSPQWKVRALVEGRPTDAKGYVGYLFLQLAPDGLHFRKQWAFYAYYDPNAGKSGFGVFGDIVAYSFVPFTGGASLALASSPTVQKIGLASIAVGAAIAGSVLAPGIGSSIGTKAGTALAGEVKQLEGGDKPTAGGASVGAAPTGTVWRGTGAPLVTAGTPSPAGSLQATAQAHPALTAGVALVTLTGILLSLRRAA